MKKGRWIKIGVFLLVMALVIPVIGIGCKEAAPTPTPKPTPTPTPTPTPKPEVVKWTGVSVWPVGGSFKYLQDQGDVPFAKVVEKRSNGRLIIELHPAGELCKATAVTSFVVSGAAELGSSCGLYTSALVGGAADVEGSIPGCPGWQDYKEFLYEFKNGATMKLLREAYAAKGLYLFLPYATGGYSMFGNVKVDKWSALKGKKMRCGSKPMAAFLKEQGAGIVALPGAEQYVALQRGTIDLTIYPIYTLEGYKLREVSKYAMKPMLQPNMWINLMVNLDAWNKLPDDLKKIAEDVGMEFLDAEAKRATAYDLYNYEKCPEWGIEMVTIAPSEMDVYYDSVIRAWDLTAAKDEYGAKAIALLKEYFKSKGWKLPE